MTANEPSNGDIDVPENFSAEEPQEGAEPLESSVSSESTEATPDDFDIDLGSYSSSRDDDVDINLDFGGATEPKPEDDFELDFGSLTTTTEEPEVVTEAEPEE